MIDLNNTCFKNDNPDILDYLFSKGYTTYSKDTKHGYWLVIQDKMILMGGNNVKSVYKQIHLVDGEFQYVKEEDVRGNKSSGTILDNRDVISHELSSFNKHGFETPEFAGELLKEVCGVFIGYIIQDGSIYPVKWEKHGRERSIGNSKFNLIPIKKHWYEDESNFPVLLKAIKSDNYVSMRSKENYLDYINSGNWRPATKEEVLSLLIKE